METIPLKGSAPATFNSIDAANNKKSDPHEDPDGAFLCSVCLEPVKDRDPVITQCGHLYCWACLYRWLNTHHSTCPVCKAGVTESNVIPIFIRGSMEDPRAKPSAEENIPNRPQGHRPDPVNLTQNNPINIGYNFGGISFSAGFGFFPSLFGLQFQSFAHAGLSANQSPEEEAQQAYLSRVLWFLAVAVVLCLAFF
mmetsp:Transcript_7339/g.14823  ORF Transcript_7339/g.14823 Transcript_7339/m.14823 type:complete len:196 (-) Transcript_7339:125-712(-)